MQNNNIDKFLNNIRYLCNNNFIKVTKHWLQKSQERNITLREVRESILDGRIIEKYNSQYLFPSCLILGMTKNSRVLHNVVALEINKQIHLITTYEPSKDEWENDFTTRKKGDRNG